MSWEEALFLINLLEKTWRVRNIRSRSGAGIFRSYFDPIMHLSRPSSDSEHGKDLPPGAVGG